jgi:hypothetical protein
MRLTLAIALALAAAGPALAADKPFIGDWDCGGYGSLSITAKTYDFGEPAKIKSAKRDGDAWELTMTSGYTVMVQVRGDVMNWLSMETGDTFECRRIE